MPMDSWLSTWAGFGHHQPQPPRERAPALCGPQQERQQGGFAAFVAGKRALRKYRNRGGDDIIASFVGFAPG